MFLGFARVQDHFKNPSKKDDLNEKAVLYKVYYWDKISPQPNGISVK